MRLLLACATALLALSIAAPAPAALTKSMRTARVAVKVAPAALELAWPAKGTLTDGFGPRWGRQHRGIDIGILTSLRLTAATGGVVRQAGYMRGYEGYGNVVILDVGRGTTLMYAHLSRIDVRRGDLVEKGQRLGLAGCTGSCTGTHLHFEVHQKGRAVNPLPFLHR